MIDLTFWNKCYYKKLEEMKLSEDSITIYGKLNYSNMKDIGLRL